MSLSNTSGVVPRTRRGTRSQRALRAVIPAFVCALTLIPNARAQGSVNRAAGSPSSPGVVRVTSGGETIPLLRTALGFTTRISLPDAAKEVLCGDLYDEQSSSGGFVVQRSDRDVFIKPLRGSVQTNLFIKTERTTYAFDLVVVANPMAMRIVYVDEGVPEGAHAAEYAGLKREYAALRQELEATRASAAASLEQQRADLERAQAERARSMREGSEQLARSAIETALTRNAAMVRVTGPSARGGGLEVALGPAILTIGDRSFLPCAIGNLSRQPITVTSAEFGGEPRRRAALDLVLPAGARRSVVLVFDGPPAPRAALRLLAPSRMPLLVLRPID